jgi:hypothetical protein
MKTEVEVFQVVTPCIVLRNVGILLRHYMASQPRRPRLESKNLVAAPLDFHTGEHHPYIQMFGTSIKTSVRGQGGLTILETFQT